MDDIKLDRPEGLNNAFKETIKNKSAEFDKSFNNEMTKDDPKEMHGVMMESCASSNVSRHGFAGTDPMREAGTVAIQFKNGAIYHYKDVPLHLYQELKECSSIGVKVNQSLRGKFDFEKMPDIAE